MQKSSFAKLEAGLTCNNNSELIQATDDPAARNTVNAHTTVKLSAEIPMPKFPSAMTVKDRTQAR